MVKFHFSYFGQFQLTSGLSVTAYSGSVTILNSVFTFIFFLKDLEVGTVPSGQDLLGFMLMAVV